MASILFDDISFPRELYDPDTFEFVAPVSTLLSFTPHILSQLAKDSETEQEPFLSNPASPSAAADSNAPGIHSESTPSSSSSASPNDTGFFSTLKKVAADQSARKILENGLHLATQIMDSGSNKHSNAESSSSSSSGRRSNQQQQHDQDNYRYTSAASNPSSSWFGNTNSNSCFYDTHRDQERRRMQDLENRLRQMERDMAQSSVLARSEIESQRRERTKLEQELEAQKAKVKKLEKETEERKEKEKNEQKDRKEKERQQQRQQEQKANMTKKEDETKEQESTEGKSETKPVIKKEEKDGNAADAMSAVVLATVGAASLVMTMYSAHKASSLYSVVTFHDQLEVLLQQCEGVVQSTEAWMSEQFLEVPDQIRADLKMIKELMETIQRLDPRTEKKAESIAWSMSAVGSLGALGGAVIGSMTAMASGGTLVVGCALYGVIARARYNGPEYKGARTMLELRAAQVLKSLGVSSNPNPKAPTITNTGGQGSSISTKSTRIHDERIERLRLEFEKREGHDMRDADEIDGLIVEDALRESSFSAPFVASSSNSNSTSTSTSISPLPSMRKNNNITGRGKWNDTLMTESINGQDDESSWKQQARLSTASLA
ncbi:hypothetical protein BG004_000141 [Podila humilis]|nr:hypothetical protein BG004_000141 [Podila humilis]